MQITIPTESNTIRGTIYLREDLHQFVVQKENLNPDNPVLDLSQSFTVVRHELSRICKRVKELDMSFKKKDTYYSTPLSFVPSDLMLEQRRFHLDNQAIDHFNQFLIFLRNELVNERVLTYIDQKQSIREQKSLREVYENFLIDYNFDYDWESLKRSDTRVRTLRKQQRRRYTLSF